MDGERLPGEAGSIAFRSMETLWQGVNENTKQTLFYLHPKPREAPYCAFS